MLGCREILILRPIMPLSIWMLVTTYTHDTVQSYTAIFITKYVSRHAMQVSNSMYNEMDILQSATLNEQKITLDNTFIKC